MVAKSYFVSSVFQRLDTTDFVVILIAIGLICVSWPALLGVIMLGMFLFPMYLVWRVVEMSLRNLT